MPIFLQGVCTSFFGLNSFEVARVRSIEATSVPCRVSDYFWGGYKEHVRAVKGTGKGGCVLWFMIGLNLDSAVQLKWLVQVCIVHQCYSAFRWGEWHIVSYRPIHSRLMLNPLSGLNQCAVPVKPFFSPFVFVLLRCEIPVVEYGMRGDLADLSPVMVELSPASFRNLHCGYHISVESLWNSGNAFRLM